MIGLGFEAAARLRYPIWHVSKKQQLYLAIFTHSLEIYIHWPSISRLQLDSHRRAEQIQYVINFDVLSLNTNGLVAGSN